MPELIESPHGTVCKRCLLWPDLCVCSDPENWLRKFLRDWFGTP
jgi:hypothetical protein